MNSAKLLKRYRIDAPDRFKLAAFDCADTGGLDLGKKAEKAMLAEDTERLADLQGRLYAEHRWAVLIVLQGMDTAGKDGVIKHVMKGISPLGCEVHPFKAPSADELDHDFLWRVAMRLPARGRIGIFNRSHYEEVLVVRVHPELLEHQRLPAIGRDIWKQRFESICAFERHLARSGTLVLKFFLHVSKEEQRKRLIDRIEEPVKRWKFAMGDVSERKLWDKYMAAYEDMIRATSQPEAPWYVVPADHKRFARIVVARAMIDAMDKLNLKFPKVEGAALKELQQVREALEAEGS